MTSVQSDVEFQELLWQKANELYRDMPWREDTRPYYVLVSEIMLQQTQVDRVRIKFAAFITVFPDIGSLARASLSEVLVLWSGLGYNRRAKFLHEAAKKIQEAYGGTFPSTLESLVTLPGVGPNTAGAILAYSFNQPVVFVETNVRTVLFHHFYEDQTSVSDKELRLKLAELIDTEHPREFYWGLMDYGSWLKRQGAGRLTQSSHYKKQAPLKGSVREIRGLILKALVAGDLSSSELLAHIPNDDRYEPAMKGLLHDELVEQTNGRFHLTR